jgi:transposase
LVAGRNRLSERSAPGRRGEVLSLVRYQTLGDLHDAERVCGHAVIGDDALAHPKLTAAQDPADVEVAFGWVPAKRNHMLVAVDAQTGAVRGQLAIAARDTGSLDALRFAARLEQERVWAIEDSRHVSARLEGALLAAGERVIRVPAAMTGQARRTSRQAGKSDPIDARAVALVVVRDGIESFPQAFCDEHAMEIRVLTDYRDQIICERTRMINRLRWHLVTIAPDLEAQLSQAALKGPRICARLTRQLARLPQSPRLRVARQLLKRITEIGREETQLLAELTSLIDAHAPQLLAQPGCGTVTAAIIIGRTAGAQRFPTDGHFARHAGTAPIPASSGKTQRHRLHRGGDRQLNRAIHIIAFSRARTDPETRAYLARKQAEGKTKLEAIRCLKRHLARRLWHLLYPTQIPTAPPALTTRSNTEIPTFT